MVRKRDDFMIIKRCEPSDLVGIEKITRFYFSKEVKMDLELEQFIYHFLVQYYFYNNDLSIVLIDNDVKAFILANMKNENNDYLNIFKNTVNKLSSNNIKLAYDYLDYIEYNHKRVLAHMEDNSIYLGLIASVVHHGGINLLTELKQLAKNKNVHSIYLWTDETCNYHYYEVLGFKLIDHYETRLYDVTLKTFIYKIEL